MSGHLKCFLSASYGTDLKAIKLVLEENHVEVFDLYDFSIGSSIQQILKRKLRQADFAIFVLSKESKNIIYEIGVCEGLGKRYLIILDKEADIPFYLEHKLSLSANLKDKDFLRISLQSFIEESQKKKKKTIIKKSVGAEKVEIYNKDIRAVLRSFLIQARKVRKTGQGKELEYIVEEIFKTLRLRYAQNVSGPDIGIDFALWNDKLSRVIGNPIIVEVKYGTLSNETFFKAEQQIQVYAEKSDAKVALLLYLDKEGKRHKSISTLRPLIISFDVEDFINELLQRSFENIILTQRNKIAHGID